MRDRHPHVRKVSDEYDFTDENVTNIVKKTKVEYVKSPRYVSIHKKRMKWELARVKSSHKTLGQPKVPLQSPCDFLKKGSRITPERPKITHVHFHKPDYIHDLPKWSKVTIPKNPCPGIEPLPTDPVNLGRCNFRKKNIQEVKKYEKKPEKFKTVDTVKGDVQELVPSGLMPIYIHKKTFGQVPEFLFKKKKPLKLPFKCGMTGMRSKTPPEAPPSKPLCRYITEEERENLLKEMQKKRGELMKVYQCLPFLIDTPPKVKRKAALESTLKQLEKDIELVESHQYIYVYGEEN